MAGNGVSAFRGIQAGKQATFGTAVAANMYMLGTLQLTPQTQFYNPREERNSRIETHRVVPVARHGEMRFESSLQFQRAHTWMSMIMGEPGKTNSGVGAGALSTLDTGPATKTYLYAFRPEPDALLVPSIWTIEYGDNAQFYEMQDSFVRNLSLRYDMNNAVMLSADMFGKFPVETTRSGSITQPFVHDAVSQFTDVYVGDVTDDNFDLLWSEAGTTAAATLKNIGANGEPSTGLNPTSAPAATVVQRRLGLAQSINISIPTGIEMTRYTSGGLDFTDFGQMYRTISMDLTLRHSDDGRLEFAKYVNLADRRRLFRMVTKGPLIETVGSVDYHHLFIVDMTLLYSDSPQFFTEQGGDDLFTIRGSGYHEGNAKWDRDMVVYVQTDRVTDATN